MKYPQHYPEDRQTVAVELSRRWEVYYRLQDLDVPCYCSCNEPLQIEIRSPLVGIQVWQVMRQVTCTRQELIDWLESCWEKDGESLRNYVN